VSYWGTFCIVTQGASQCRIVEKVDVDGIAHIKEILLIFEGHLTTYLYKKVFNIELLRAPGNLPGQYFRH
jgi:hypothetical protein